MRPRIFDQDDPFAASIRVNFHRENSANDEQKAKDRLLIFRMHQIAIITAMHLPYLEFKNLLQTLPPLIEPEGMPMVNSDASLQRESFFSVILKSEHLSLAEKVDLFLVLLNRDYLIYYKELLHPEFLQFLLDKAEMHKVMYEAYLMVLNCNENDISRQDEIEIWKRLIPTNIEDAKKQFITLKRKFNEERKIQYIEVWMSQIQLPRDLTMVFNWLASAIDRTIFGNKFLHNVVKIAKVRLLLLYENDARQNRLPYDPASIFLLAKHRSQFFPFGTTKSTEIHRLFQSHPEVASLKLAHEITKTQEELQRKIGHNSRFSFQ